MTALELLIRHRHEINRQIVNIGNPDNETTIADLAARLIKIYRAHCDSSAVAAIEEVSAEEFYGPGYEDCDRRVPDISKLKRLGWFPRYDRLESLLQRADRN